MTRGKVIVVCGLIGSGKSTLSGELAQTLGEGTLFLPEPDEKDAANPYLNDYYVDTPRWSFTMQCHLLSKRYAQHQRAQWHVMDSGHNAVMDSSFYQDTAFARLQKLTHVMSEREFDTYSNLYRSMTAAVLLPSVCVRIIVSPGEAANRIKSRLEKRTGRACESTIPIEYLRGLDAEINHMCNVLSSQGVTILPVPWDEVRETKESRESEVVRIATDIRNVQPADLFLDIHKRVI